MGTRAAMRAACASLLAGYAASAGVKLQVYPGRPRSVFPPCAFVDGLGETVRWLGPELAQRTPTADIVVLHGEFDSGESVAQADALVDGLIAYTASRYGEAGANTVLGITRVSDEPGYVADWIAPSGRTGGSTGPYFATRITVEGLSLE